MWRVFHSQPVIWCVGGVGRDIEREFFLSVLVYKTEQNNTAFIHSRSILQGVAKSKEYAKYSGRCLGVKLPYHGTVHKIDTPEIFVKLK